MLIRACFIAVAALSGCAVPPPGARSIAIAPDYVPPASGPTARLLLRMTQPAGKYTVSTYEQPVGCSHRRDITSGTASAPERQSVVITAGKLQTFSYFFLRTDNQACQAIFSFEPRARQTYLMRSKADAQGCAVELLNASNPDAPAFEPSRISRERNGFGLMDNACKPIASTRPPPARPGAPPPADANSLDAFKDLLPRDAR